LEELCPITLNKPQRQLCHCSVPVSMPGMRLVLNMRSYWDEHMGMVFWSISCEAEKMVTNHCWADQRENYAIISTQWRL